MKPSDFSPPAAPSLWPQPIAILGYGAEGKSTLAHLRRWGYRDLVVLDKTAPVEPLPPGVRAVFGPGYLEALNDSRDPVRTAFRSPGLRPFVPEIEAFKKRGGLLTSQVEAAFTLAGRHRIIGVTGTVGKGTCCSLLAAMLGQAAIPCRLAGNIGVPPLDALFDDGPGITLPPAAWLLLELSSFQLSTLGESPAIAVVLRTTSEHLDWHASQNEYWDHKANLTRFQEPGDLCVYFADSPGSRAIGLAGRGRKIAVGAHSEIKLSETVTQPGLDWPAGGIHLTLADTRMTGAFNLENVGAAAAVAQALGASPAAVRAGAAAFSPLEHRIEFVRTVRGVRYYNDSYATRPEATLAAAKSFHDPLGLILGGSEKFADFSEMAAALADLPHLRAVALIGQTAARLEDELRGAQVIGGLEGRAWRRCESLEDALEFLRGEIAAGAILLSPACASFGMFANYKERGYAFKRLVKALPE